MSSGVVDVDVSEDDFDGEGTGGEIDAGDVAVSLPGQPASTMDAGQAATLIAGDQAANIGNYQPMPCAPTGEYGPMEFPESYSEPSENPDDDFEDYDDDDDDIPLREVSRAISRISSPEVEDIADAEDEPQKIIIRDMDGGNRWNAGTVVVIFLGLTKELALVGGTVTAVLYLTGTWPFNKGTGGKPTNPTPPVPNQPTAVDDVKMDLVHLTSVDIDVTANDTTPNGTSLDKTTVTLVGADAGSNGKTKTETNEGQWSVDATLGIVTFTPTQFAKKPKTVRYTVANDAGVVSNEAKIDVYYSIPSPLARPIRLTDLAHSNSLVIDVLANASAIGSSIDPTTVMLIEPDTGSNGKMKTVAGEGTWTVDPATGSVTFSSSQFLEDPTPVKYNFQNGNAQVSNSASIEIFFKVAKPFAAEIIVPGTIGKSDPVAVAVVAKALKQSYPLDPKSVEIVSFLDMDDPAAPVGTIANNKKSLTVPKQGTWLVDANTGVITFQPESTFVKSPFPITYRIADTKGNFSEPAAIIINEFATRVEEELLSFAAMDDDAFWAKFKNDLIDPNPPIDIEIIYVINQILWRATVVAVGGANALQDVVLPKGQILGPAYNTLYGQWTTAGFSVAALWTIMDGISDTTTGFDSSSSTKSEKIGTRMIRLDTAARLMRSYRSDLRDLQS